MKKSLLFIAVLIISLSIYSSEQKRVFQKDGKWFVSLKSSDVYGPFSYVSDFYYIDKRWIFIAAEDNSHREGEAIDGGKYYAYTDHGKYGPYDYIPPERTIINLCAQWTVFIASKGRFEDGNRKQFINFNGKQFGPFKKIKDVEFYNNGKQWAFFASDSLANGNGKALIKMYFFGNEIVLNNKKNENIYVHHVEETDNSNVYKLFVIIGKGKWVVTVDISE